MKTLLALLVILGAVGYYLHTLREENAKMKVKVDMMAESLPEEERARIFSDKPLPQGSQPAPRKGIVHKRIVCPQCKGEGAVMQRRLESGNTVDVKTICALCMGSGKREFDMPSTAEVCPDCEGMGKRVIPQSKNNRSGGQGGISQLGGGVCARCYGRGAIEKPGLR